MWDLGGKNHPMITSMREHRGYLYLGGIMNNRIGRLKLEGVDPAWAQYEWRWAKAPDAKHGLPEGFAPAEKERA